MRQILVFLVLTFILVQSSFAIEVAITIDDLPKHGNLPPNITRLDVENKILQTLRKHNISHVYGFLNGINATSNNPVLIQWVQSGNLLGNHTYSHLDLAKVNSDDYIADIQKNESLLNKLMANKNYKYFRYPYLAEGNTLQKRNAVRKFLFKNRYKIAPVTVDFFEYEWNDPYVRCLNKNDKESIEWIKKNYLEQSINGLTIAHELSMFLFNHDIKNILLIHINFLSAEMLDELLTAYEKQGVTFVSLPDALRDEVYRINPNISRDRSYTFLNQVRLSRGLENPKHIKELYNSFDEDKLNSLCN